MVPVAEAPERLVLNTKVVFADLRKARWTTVRACSWLLDEGCDYDKEFFLAMSWMVNEVGLSLAATLKAHGTSRANLGSLASRVFTITIRQLPSIRLARR